MQTRLRDWFEANPSFSSLQIPEYRLLWWAGLWAFMSMQGQMVLRGLLAWELTERESALGLIYLIFGVTMLFATPFGGVIADRLPKRTVLLMMQGLITATAAFMATIELLGITQYWMLLLASFAQGMTFAFYGPARVAMAAEIVGREQLGNAITLSLLSMNGSRVIAPALAGALAGWALIGIGGAYLLSAVLSSFALIFTWRLKRLPATGMSDKSPLADIAAGISYVRNDQRLRRIVVSSFFVIVFGFNYVAFIPALVEGEFGLGDTWVGLVSSASAIGALSVSMWLARHADGPRGGRIMVLSGIGFALGVMLLAAAPTIAVAFLIVIGIGACTTAFQSMSNTLALTTSSDEMQGRVQSIMQLSFAGFGIAALPLGAIAEAIGLRPTLVIMGAVALSAIVTLWVVATRNPSAQSTAAADPSDSIDDVSEPALGG